MGKIDYHIEINNMHHITFNHTSGTNTEYVVNFKEVSRLVNISNTVLSIDISS